MTSNILELSDIVKIAKELEGEIKKRTDCLKEAQDLYRRLTEVKIPNLMDDLEIDRFKMKDGTVIRLKRDIAASISKKNPARRSSAFKWLALHGGESICKYEFNIFFNTDNAGMERVEHFRGLLDKHSFNNFASKRQVHPGTLKKFIKDKLSKGEDVPMELFEGYPVVKAIIKQAEKN